MPLWVALAVFSVGAAGLVCAGVALAAAGDELAERTGMGRLFVGTLLVALATSLPEVVTDVTAAAVDAPDLAVADLFGSSMANMAILAIIDLRHRGRVWPVVELGHARVAAVGIVLTAIAALGLLTPSNPSIGWVGLDTLVVAGLYVAAVAWFRRVPKLVRPGDGIDVIAIPGPTGWAHEEEGRPLSALFARFGLAAAGILVSAPAVAISTKQIAASSGIDQTFLGAALLAVTTSLPELVASLAAVRIGAHDLAVGNLFGSNAVNMAVLLLADLAYSDGPILAAVDPGQAVAAVGAILLMALAVAAIVGGTETRVGRLEPDAVVVLLTYLLVLVAVAVTGAG